MPKNISSITIFASPEKVWQALTQPEMVKRWQFGSDLKTTWDIDSPIEFATEWNGKVFRQWGTVLEFEPEKQLSYELFAPRPDLEDKPENYFVMKYVLTESDGKTKLEITQEDNRPGAVQEAPQQDENPVLKALKDLVEGN